MAQARFTILKPNTPEQSVVVCLRCNVPCEHQGTSVAAGFAKTLLIGPLGLVPSFWWKCNACGKKYGDGDFKKGRIQRQRYEGVVMPTFQPTQQTQADDEDPYANYNP